MINVSDCALLHDFSGMPVYEEYCRHLGGNKQIAFSILVADKKVTLIALNKKLGNFTNRDRYVLGLLRTHMIWE